MAGKNIWNTRGKCMDIVHFIEEHFDMVSQEEYFEMCDMVLELVETLANKDGWAGKLAEESMLYEVKAQAID